MQRLSAAQLLDVWERGRARSPAGRAVLLLAAAYPDTPVEALARLPLGRRDDRLLGLREQTFGSRLVGLARCPACGERVEVAFTAADIRAAGPKDEPAEPLGLTVADFELRFRLPNSLDVDAVAGSPDLEAARRRLFERCLVAAWQGGEPVAGGKLPADVVAAVAARMAETDPRADVQLAFDCPACGRQGRTTFDVVAFFWGELHAWAQRTLREVHLLASAYGWREADVLVLSPERRHMYLAMGGG
jgi:hypothetical protein